MKSVRFLLALAAVLLAPSFASAQQAIKLSLQNGRASIDVQNVALSRILSEWARVGGVKIVNGEKVSGPPVTLQLIDVPERQALDLLLRNVSGYLLAVRAPGSKGASSFDRILILATSSAPKNPPPAAAPQAPRSAPQGGNVQDDGIPDGIPDGNGPGGLRRAFTPPPMRPGVGNVAPDSPVQDGAQPPAAAPPGNPFGAPPGSGLPGVITPVAPPPQDPNRR